MKREVQAKLKRLGVSPRKSRGQNFLIDANARDRLLREFSGSGSILEIGPGLGIMTEGLLKTAERLVVVEREKAFCKLLRQDYPQIEEVIEADIRDVKPEELVEPNSRLSVYGNIPYSISSDIINWTLSNRSFIDRACYLMQREFAARVAASPGSKAYGSLSVFCQTYADASLGALVPADAFFPVPEVDSCSLVLKMLPEPRLKLDSPENFERFVRGAFATRRKTLLNNMLALYKGVEKGELADLIEAVVEPGTRAERLSLEQFGSLYHRLRDALGDFNDHAL